ncbi:hypothetical protein Gotri_026142 [Gossypium trilobum]|uniref:Uncharacterized protein n=1 Tax=Gossypium trilobum TaxID=34281 RepID=A0A7J9FVG0_9ROSI|nr:hypothetical protein [Gossypium trilobum]
MKVDKHLFRALAQFWNLAYSCFTFGKVDLVPSRRGIASAFLGRV